MDYFGDLFAKLKGRKIFFYGADATGIRLLHEAEKRNVNVQYVVDRDIRKQGSTILGKKILDPYDLMYESYSDASIVVTAPVGKQSIINTLLDMGFSLEKNIVLDYVDKYNNLSLYCNDQLLGISRGKNTIVEMRPSVPFEKVMLVLGGSTTDPNYNNIKSWPYFLQEIFDNNSINVKVLNSGVIGYTSAQELLLLLRDGLSEKPDYLVDLSGYNDFAPALNVDDEGKYNFVSRNTYLNSEGLIKEYVKSGKKFSAMYYGEKTTNNIGVFLNNQSYIKALCEFFKIQYWSFLQPNVFSIERIPGSMASRLWDEPMTYPLIEEWRKFYDGYLKQKELFPYIIDFTGIISDADDVFEDYVHVTELGNRLIAKKIYEFLLNNLNP